MIIELIGEEKSYMSYPVELKFKHNTNFSSKYPIQDLFKVSNDTESSNSHSWNLRESNMQIHHSVGLYHLTTKANHQRRTDP